VHSESETTVDVPSCLHEIVRDWDPPAQGTEQAVQALTDQL